MLGRLAIYALSGAAVGALIMFGYHYYVLAAAGADPFSISAYGLLVEVMELPGYAVFGAVVGAVVAPFPGRGSPALWRIAGWTGAGALAAALVSYVRLVKSMGSVPSFSETLAGYAMDHKYLWTGLGTGAALALFESAYQAWVWRNRWRTAGANAAEPNDVDAVLKDFWRERADSYLQSRQQRREEPEP